MKYGLKMDGNKLCVEFSPILNETTIYKLDKNGAEKPSVWYTATSRMVDFIGNIISIGKNSCVVRGVYNGVMRVVKNIKILDKEIKRIGQRVMVTEHIDISGKFELIATTRRILYGDLNFINVGYPTRYAIIDVYTGQHKIVETYTNVNKEG